MFEHHPTGEVAVKLVQCEECVWNMVYENADKIAIDRSCGESAWMVAEEQAELHQKVTGHSVEILESEQ